MLAVAAAWALTACGDGGGQTADEPARREAPAANVERGGRLYRRHGCALCHGASGRGDGRLAHTFSPPPRDFRDPGSFRHGHGIDEISEVIRDGVAAGGRRAMPTYGHLSRADRRSLALYIRSLATE